MTNQDNPGSSAQIASIQPEIAAQELVLIYASLVPPQLEHWLRKRNLRMHLNDRKLDPNEVRSSGARFVVIDLDELPREHPPVETVRHLRIHVPEVRLLVVTSRTDPQFSRALVEAGARGVVIKQPYVADLVFALHAAGEGRTYVSGQTSERERAAVQITAREKEVLELMAHGHSNQSIGERLSISVKTVEAHRARLFKKLGASNVADAVLLAIRTGLVMP